MVRLVVDAHNRTLYRLIAWHRIGILAGETGARSAMLLFARQVVVALVPRISIGVL